MKLGFVLKITNGGESEAFSINNNNNESWARYAADARSAIKDLSNFDETEKIVYLIKFLGTSGYLIGVIKARPEGSGRPNDNTAAWIHIPANVAISAEDTISILKAVEEAISEEKGTDKERLENIFNLDYASNDAQISAVGTLISSNESQYAIRYFNEDFSLKELLGPSIAQQEYGKYKGIVLVDKKQGISHTSKNELNFEPRKICIYEPLPPIDGFTPCFLSHDKYYAFNKTIEVPEGTQVTIYWKKNGYAIIKKSFVAHEDPRSIAQAQINQSEYKIIIPRKLFYVTDNEGIPVDQFDIRINHQLMEGDFMEISEGFYQQGLYVSITARGFSEWRQNNIRPQLDRALTIRLPKRIYHYEFAIPVYDGKRNTQNDAIVVVESQTILKSSPIKGYVTYDRVQEGEGRINRLEIDDRWMSKLKYIAYGFASCILVLLLYAGCSALENYEFQLKWPPLKVKQHQQSTGITESVDDLNSPQENNLPKNIAFLDRNNVWHKDSLNKYPETQGLFEELNDFQYENIKRRRDESQLSSQNLEKILNALSENKAKGYNPHIGKEKFQGKYNSDSDKEISIDNYIDWLSSQHEEYVAQPIDNQSKVPAKTHSSNITGKPVPPIKKENTTVESKKSRGGL